MIAIFLAPISAGIKINDKHTLALDIKLNEVMAVNLFDCLDTSTFTAEATSDTITLDYRIKLSDGYKTDALRIKCYSLIKGFDIFGSGTLGTEGRKEGLFLFYYETGNKNIINFSFDDLGLIFSTGSTENPVSGAPAYKASPERFHFKPDTEYTAGLAIVESCWGTPYLDQNGVIKNGYSPSVGCVLAADTSNNTIIKKTTFRTPKDFTHKEVSFEEYANSQASGGATELDLGCTSLTSISLSGCVAQLAYIIWSVTALIARLTAHFLDFFIYYATNSSSYNNSFVKQAWAAVRDVANIFFIIALLYVAIKTILGLNVTDNKKLIGSVIIVALIINFSLFTTQLVIDGSNILAKVFYNNIISKDASAKNADGTLQNSEAEAGGQKSISVGIIDKFNPQGLVIQSVYDTNPYTFIFLTLLLIVVTLYTAYIFLSVSLLFVARVVSLWLAMIFSPLAFASYTVPFDIPGFGHKEWWSSLLENAVLAPLFIFFLYIIILFTGFLNNIINYTDSPNLDTMANLMQRIMSVTIPFIIIVMLLTKAKELALKYSGEMGKTIAKAGAVVGGLALGGGALGLATVGRSTVGSFMKGASTGDTAANRMQGSAARIATHQAVLTNPNSTIVERTHARKEIRREQRDQIKGAIQNFGIGNLSYAGAQTWMGARLNQDQHNIEHAAHARHELDTTAGEIAHGKKWDELNGEERFQARRKLARDRWVRDNSQAQGFGTRKWEALTDAERGIVDAAPEVGVDAHGAAIAGLALDTHTTWADTHIIQDARVKQGAISNIVQSTVTGSYDARNLSKIVAKEQSTGFAKFTAGITGALASGMRSSLKSTLNINYGEGQKNFFKDLGNTISEAMKGAKINVDLSHVGEQKKEEHKGGGEHH